MDPDERLWHEVVNAIRSIVRHYLRMNRAMSLGFDRYVRMRALARLTRSRLLLDVGCGPGTMGLAAVRIGTADEAVLLDPLPEMLSIAKTASRRLSERVSVVQGVIEHAPFRDRAFPAAIAAYSLRDVANFVMAVRSIAEVLTRGGKLVVLDVHKPSSGALKILLLAFWKVVPPVVAIIMAPRVWKHYSKLFATFVRYPDAKTLSRLISRAFGSRCRYFRTHLGAAILESEKA